MRGRRWAATASCAARAPPFPTPSPRCSCTSATSRAASRDAYFGWTEGNPLAYVLRYLALGEGDTAPVTREVLRKAIKNPLERPRIHVG